jgi:hypothetical protein
MVGTGKLRFFHKFYFYLSIRNWKKVRWDALEERKLKIVVFFLFPPQINLLAQCSSNNFECFRWTQTDYTIECNNKGKTQMPGRGDFNYDIL